MADLRHDKYYIKKRGGFSFGTAIAFWRCENNMKECDYGRTS
jgi:hypothetical protein